jgi:putative redox protein
VVHVREASKVVNVKVVHTKKMQFRGENESGVAITMDASREFGGENAGTRPMEMLLMSLGGCTGMDVVEILRKKRQEVTGYEINVSGERREDHPRVFTNIRVEHVVRGKNIDGGAVQRAVELSTDKYCSVMGMLKDTAKIDVSFRVEAEQPVSSAAEAPGT